MSWRKLLRRGPSDDLTEAQKVHHEVLAQREEVENVTTSLRESVRKPNGLAPLIEHALRNAR